jgi:hypothetical protein
MGQGVGCSSRLLLNHLTLAQGRHESNDDDGEKRMEIQRLLIANKNDNRIVTSKAMNVSSNSGTKVGLVMLQEEEEAL